VIEPDFDKLWYQTNLDVFLNRWFSTYDDARRSLDGDGGFLLPYKKHFFVCEADVIQAMGLEPDDPDWERIGRDGAQPNDQAAYQRLCEKRAQAVQEASAKASSLD
jgi:hypothetical protein